MYRINFTGRRIMFGAKKKTMENLHKFDRGKGKSAVGIIIAIAVLVILVSG